MHKTRRKINRAARAIVCCLAVLFAGCETDNIAVKNQEPHSQAAFEIKKMSFGDFRKNNRAFQKLNEVRKGNSPSSMKGSGIHEGYGVSVDTTNIVRLEKDGRHSITMRITNSGQKDRIENLVLTSKEDGGYTAYLAEYLLSAQEMDVLYQGASLAKKRPSSLTNMQDTEKSAMQSSGTDCVDVRTQTENYCNDSNGNTIVDNGDNDGRCVSGWVSLEYTIVIIDVGCLSGGSGGTGGDGDGGPGGDGPGPGGPGGGTGGGGGTEVDEDGNPIFTVPILQAPRNSINELKKQANRPEVKARINTLKAGVRTIAMEQGTEFFTSYTDPENAPFVPEDLEPSFSGVQFGDVYDNSILRLHSHHDGLEPVFSAEDVKEMGFFYKRKIQLGATDANNITVMMVSDLGIFALRVTDPAKAKQFSYRIVSSDFVKIFIKAYARDVQENAFKDCNCVRPHIEYEKLLSDYLIKFLADQETGLTLYSAQLDSNGNYTWNIHPKYNQ